MYGGESFVASGNIAPMRIVAIVPGTDYKVVQAVAADKPIGVSGTYLETYDGTYHATDGRTCRVYMAGSPEPPLLELGGTVSAGDYVAPDANGKGIAVSTTATAHDDVLGVAIQSGLSGEFIKVKVGPFGGPQSN